MTENKNSGNDPSAEFERLRKRKVLLFAAILGCIFLVAMWLIFRPAPVKPQEGAAGINTSVPDGKAQATVSDKRKAAEQLRSEEQQQKRMMTLGDNSFSLLDDGLKPAEEPAPGGQPRTAGRRGQQGHAAAGAGLLCHSAEQCRGRSPERAGRGPANPSSMPSGSSPIRWSWPRSSTSSHGSISAAERPRTKSPGRQSSEGIRACP